MSSLTPTDITAILLALGVLLATARILGELATWLRQPAIIGEILAGVILGPTILGQIDPELKEFLFPSTGPPAHVRDGITAAAVVLFLLVAGMEVDLSAIFRQGRAAMNVSISGVAIPFALGFLVAWLAPNLLGREGGSAPVIFALFFATALSISALPVIAKILMDLNLYRSDIGMVIIAAAIFDDLIGWIIFAIVLGLFQESGSLGLKISETVGLTLLFVAFMLTIGRWSIHRSLPWLQAHTTWPGGVISLTLVLALLGGALTSAIGIHAVFGAFMVGVAIGDSPHLRERTRTTIDQFVSSIFAPLFFASIGLQIDFVEQFDWLLVLIVLVLAMIAKVGGCGLGARLAGMSWRESWAVGFGMNARGAMGIILGLLAREAGVIGDRLFVALVVMAVVTSVISGTMMQRILRRTAARTFLDFLHQRGFINPLQSSDREGAIAELARAAASITGLKAEALAEAVLERERMMPTGMGLTVAVPHARLHGLNKPVVCVGISPLGVDFNARDGELSNMIFLILTPTEDDGAQVEILGDIARMFADEVVRGGARKVANYTEFIALLKTREARKT